MGNPKTAASKVDPSRQKRQKTGGRIAGTPNKVTKELKETILGALDKAGGMKYLQTTAKTHPAAFLALIGKVLPMTIQGPNPDGSHTFTVNAPWLQQQVQKRNS
jgi:hypothetical protein